MPIYEYQCDKCGEVFEVFQKLNDPPPKRHTCGSRKVHRLISRSSFILKGTGWYVTDYARKDKGESGSTKSKKNDKDKGKPSESGTSKSSDSGASKPSDSGASKPSESGTGKAETASVPAKVA